MVFVPNADIYLGPASFGPRKGTVAIIWHTTEAASFTRTAAVGTAEWQKSNPGSYNWIIYDAKSTGAKGGALLTVPYREASGGVNPASPAWAPERFPWLKQVLPAAAYSDPNAYQLNVAFSGRTADILAGKMPLNMYETAARLTKWVEDQTWGVDNLIFSGHLHWQSNRSDPGQPTIDKILAEYQRIFNPVPVPTPPPDYKALYVAEQAKVADLTTKLRSARAGIAKRDAYIEAYPG